MKEKAIFCWSGGKDSALALYRILQENKYKVVGLLTTLNETHKRVSMHGVREELLEMQAESIDIPLIKMFVSEGTNSEYENKMRELLLKWKGMGVSKIIFGDIFLEDLRLYRENNLKETGLTAEFPLWKENTQDLISEFLSLGFKTVICCVNDAFLGEESVGKEITGDFVKQLPENIDPCGENGEYHTFCYEGPIFKKRIKFSAGKKVYKPLEIKTGNDSEKISTKGFWFIELKGEE
jgi:uncharacterized protein (TIGR00290 family)